MPEQKPPAPPPPPPEESAANEQGAAINEAANPGKKSSKNKLRIDLKDPLARRNKFSIYSNRLS